MRISSVQALRIRASAASTWLFVEIHTDEGITGTGEASDGDPGESTEWLILNRLAPQIRGRDPRDVESLWRDLVTTNAGDNAQAPTRSLATALSGIEIALRDIVSRVIGIPMYQLLGQQHNQRVRVYANLNRARRGRSPEALAATARSAVDAGFRAVKCMPFHEVVPHESDPKIVRTAIDRAIARISAIRSTVGSEVDLLVDCHGRLTRDLAVEVGHRLLSLRPYWYEEPLRPADDLEGLAAVAASLETPVAAGEHLFGARRFREVLEARAADILMPDVKHCGGIKEAYLVAGLAASHGLPVAPHNPSGPISTLASLHLAAAMPNCLLLEYPFDDIAWRTDLVDGAECLADGTLIVPQSPGLGGALSRRVAVDHGVISRTAW